MESCGLYIHIPFCKSKCSYCSFTSFANCGDRIEDYIEAIKKEILFHKKYILLPPKKDKIKKYNIIKRKEKIAKEPEQITFFQNKNSSITQNKFQVAHLMPSSHRTLIVRESEVANSQSNNQTLVSDEHKKIPHLPNNLQFNLENGSDEFKKKMNLLNSRLEKGLQRVYQRNKNYILKTIYIGGGTPSILSEESLVELLDFIRDNFVIDSACEITVEANPDSFTLSKAMAWKKAGINRISFGVQSDEDKVLKKLGRVHNFEQFITAIHNAKKAGFDNINADILLGLPNQTTEQARKTVQNIVRLGVTHISAYGLIVENGTSICNSIAKGEIVLPSDERAVEIYNAVVDELQSSGFFRYEISNFAKVDSEMDGNKSDALENKVGSDRGDRENAEFVENKEATKTNLNENMLKYQCKHNVNYWSRGEFLGVGLGAYSFLNGEHWENTVNLDEYIKEPYIRRNIEPESKKTAMNETIMLALRCQKGLDMLKFNQTFNVHFERMYQKQIKKLSENNLIKIEDNHLKIVDFEVSNYVISEFFC